MEAEACVRCGCTESTPCLVDFGTCSWFEEDLCTACVTPDELAELRSILLYGADGRPAVFR